MTDHGRLFDLDDYRVDTGPAAPPLADVAAVALVVPDVAGFDKTFDYAVPSGLADRVQIGTQVGVPLGGRSVLGWVVGLALPDAESRPADYALKPIDRVRSAGPCMELVDVARWAAHRWHGRWSAVLAAATPPRVVPPFRPGPSRQEPLGTTAESAARLTSSVELVRHGPTDDLLPLIESSLGPRSTIVIVPQLDNARRLAGRLRAAGHPVRVHPRDWAAAAHRGGIVIGARSAVWARVADLDTIVVVDEHDEALQEERNPTWHAREVAIERMRRVGGTCRILSPSPTVSAVVAAHTDQGPSRQAQRASWPIVDVVDQRQVEPGRATLFSSRVVELVRSGGRVVAVLNRTGRAVMLACSQCGELVLTNDGLRLMVERDGQLMCPETGETRPIVCAHCASTRLKRLRLGVARAAEELAALAGEPVTELTSTSNRKGPTQAGRVVVGTEAALRQLNHADAVVFLDFDQEMLSPRYRAGEQALHLLVQASRLVGPRSGGGRIVVQTRHPDHQLLAAARLADPGRFIDAERETRQLLGLPPFAALAEVRGAGAAELAAHLQADPELTVLGPRKGDRYLVRASSPDVLAERLAAAPAGTTRARIAVDPPRV
ncbi:MAG: hypothetical protein AAF467_24200 [Actinomycetota bacterium]